MQYSQEHLKTMVYAKFGGQTECIMGNWKIENMMSRKSSFGTQIFVLVWHWLGKSRLSLPLLSNVSNSLFFCRRRLETYYA